MGRRDRWWLLERRVSRPVAICIRIPHCPVAMGRGGEMTDDVAFLRAREQHATKALKELRLSMHSRIEKANADVIAERHRAEAERDRLREELMGMRAACSTKDEKISQLSRRLARMGGKYSSGTRPLSPDDDH